MRAIAMAQDTINHTVGGVISANDPTLRLCVFATTDAGTAAALASARNLSLGLNPRITLLVPVAVPYPQPIDAPAISVGFIEDHYRTMAEAAQIDVLVRVFVCRPEAADLQGVLPPNAAVLIGGITRRWWHTREQRLARRLAARGHRVLFVHGDRLARRRLGRGGAHAQAGGGDKTASSCASSTDATGSRFPASDRRECLTKEQHAFSATTTRTL